MEKQVVFRAYNSKRQEPIRLMPLEDKSGKLFTGQGDRGYLEFLTEDERKKFPVIIDRQTSIVITDGKVLDLDDPIDAQNWKWIQRHPYIAMDRHDGNSSRDAVFYIDNPDKEAEVKVTKDKRITVAKSRMYNASNVKKVNLAKALGNPGAESMKIERVEEWLAIKAEKTPDTIIALLDDKATAKVAAMTLYEDIKRFNLLTRHAGTWRLGGVEGNPLGNSDAEVIEFILDKKNEEQVFVIQNLLKEKLGE